MVKTHFSISNFEMILDKIHQFGQQLTLEIQMSVDNNKAMSIQNQISELS